MTWGWHHFTDQTCLLPASSCSAWCSCHSQGCVDGQPRRCWSPLVWLRAGNINSGEHA